MIWIKQQLASLGRNSDETYAVAYERGIVTRQEAKMRLVLFTLAITIGTIAVGTCAFGGRAMSQSISQNLAQNYPWCAYYAKAGANCGFATYEQCMAALSGNGGFCNINSQYVPPTGPRGGPAYQLR